MRIGICGAQSTGKTTLLNELMNQEFFFNYKFCVESTREIYRLGLNINERGDDITQKMIMQHHFFNLIMYENMIADRTTFDCYTYTRYLNEIGQVSDDMLQLIEQALLKSKKLYDMIFYIRPEFDIVDDGVRSIDVNFRDRISQIFENTLYIHAPEQLVVVSGDIQTRVKQVLDTLKGIN